MRALYAQRYAGGNSTVMHGTQACIYAGSRRRRMKGTQRLQKILYLIIAILGNYIIYKAGRIVLSSPAMQQALDSGEVQRMMEDGAVRTWAPAYAASVEETADGNWIAGWMSQAAPVYSYLADKNTQTEMGSAPEEEISESAASGEASSEETGNVVSGGALPEGTGNAVSGEASPEGTGDVVSGEAASEETGKEASDEAAPEGTGKEVSDEAAPEGMGKEASDEAAPEGTGNEASDEAAPEGTQENTASETDVALTGGMHPHQEVETKSEISQASSVNIVSETLLEQLEDFSYLLANYYTVDAGTSADAQLLDADTLLGEDLTIEKKTDEPQILIYHTHSQETFIDSEEGNTEDSIVGMGEVLAQELRDTYGYQVIHDTGVYDLIDGVLDRSAAYDYARQSIQQVLADNPTIEVVIDLHRDGVEGQKFVTQIDGKPTSMVMFFNGISRDSNAQPLYWLENPYIQQNLAFSLQMQLAAQRLYPGFTRNIYLKAERFNLHLRPRSLLIEAGTQLNTVEEEKNAMRILAELLNCVLGGA